MTAPPEPQTKYDSFKVYNQQAALTLCADLTTKRSHTVRIEAAARNPGRRDYDWESKVPIQLTLAELDDFAALLMGWSSHFQCGYHGPQRNKAIEMTRNERGTIHVAIRAARRFDVNMGRHDARRAMSLVRRQLALENGLTSQEVLLDIKRQLELSRVTPPAADQG